MRNIIFQENIHTDSFDDEEAVYFTVCDRSDSTNPQVMYPDDQVLIIEWRSPIGDDLKLTIPRVKLRDWLEAT